MLYYNSWILKYNVIWETLKAPFVKVKDPILSYLIIKNNKMLTS